MFNEIYNCDCLEGMKEIPSGTVDFICSDLPYGLVDCEWDRRLPLEPMWEQFNRVTKENAAIALFSAGKFLIELAASNLKYYRYKIVWLKAKGCGFLNAKKMPLRAHEDILIFYRKLPTYNPQFTQGKPYKKVQRTFSPIYSKQKPTTFINDGRRYPRDYLFDYGTTKEHSTQKPVDLLSWLIKTYTNEGEVVLDATIGSGSTAVACIETGRRFIGFELDEHYYEVAKRRISEAQAKKAAELFYRVE